MSPVSRIALFAAGLFIAAWPAYSKGILVRFLPNPPEDSVTEYHVLRSDGPGGAPTPVGRVDAAAGRDTLAFADTSACKGLAYRYSILALDAWGGVSDPSESTEVALPALTFPDTLRAGSQGARWTLPLGADPLSGAAPLDLALQDSARFTLRYDAKTHQAEISPREGAGSGWAVVIASYYGKFADRDSVWIGFGGTGMSDPMHRGRAETAEEWPASWSPRLGLLTIVCPAGAREASGRGASGAWTLLTARGETVATLRFPSDGSNALWDGRDAHGRPVEPAAYLWAARGPRGALLRSGSLRILP